VLRKYKDIYRQSRICTVYKWESMSVNGSYSVDWLLVQIQIINRDYCHWVVSYLVYLDQMSVNLLGYNKWQLIVQLCYNYDIFQTTVVQICDMYMYMCVIFFYLLAFLAAFGLFVSFLLCHFAYSKCTTWY